MEQAPEGKEIATLAGGVSGAWRRFTTGCRGVESVESGYMGGQRPNRATKRCATGTPDTRRLVRVTFDPERLLSYRDLLECSSLIHDRPPSIARARRRQPVPLGDFLPHAPAESGRKKS